MKSGWRTHNGVRFFYADYSHFGRDINALRLEVDDADTEIEQSPRESALVLVDIRNTVTTTDVVSLFKHSTARTKGFVAKTAIVGVTGVQKVLVAAVARFSRETLHVFKETEDAMDWLAGAEERGGLIVRP